MKVGEAEAWLAQQLNGLYKKGEAAQMAAMVLESLTGCSRTERLTRSHEPLGVQQLHTLRQAYQRLQQHEPVQYVLEEAWFYGLKLYVDKNVLIPRPETEELVDWMIKDAAAANKNVFEKAPTDADLTTELKILDVGTGSGCIALALKKSMPRAELWGCDTSDAALAVARRNGAELDIRVDFVGLNFLDAAQRRQLPTTNVIVSNPPYIPIKEKNTMHPNVVLHEPHQALFVPNENPLVFYDALALFGHERLRAGGTIYTEIHEEAGSNAALLFAQHGYTTELKKDMQGKDRMLKATRKD